MLGLPDGENALRLEDIMRPEGLKLMKRDVRGQAAAKRAFTAMMGMHKIDIAAIEAARKG